MFFRSRRRTRSPCFFGPAIRSRLLRPVEASASLWHALRSRPSALLPDLLLLAGDGALRALARARIGLRVLPPDGKAQRVAHPLVRTDVDLPPDVLLDLAAEFTFDL